MDASTGGLMPTGKLTIRQIAKLAGVSHSSVSRVLNNHPNVSPETREQVQKAINQTGYQPDLMARSLSSRRSHIIGRVIPLAIRGFFDDPLSPRLTQGISQGCTTYDYALSLFLFHSREGGKSSSVIGSKGHKHIGR
jgi:LacI family transcriptional regulator